MLNKGNIWSAIPVALLCKIVNLGKRKEGSSPKGLKHRRTREDFCSFICSPERAGLRAERAGSKPEGAGLKPEWADLRPETADLMPERPD